MISECNFKKELSNIGKSYYKFRERDSEIRRSCYHCRLNIDHDNCILSQVYEQTLSNIELNKLLEEINNKKKEIVLLQEHLDKLDIQKGKKEKEIIDLNKEIEILNNKVVKIRANDFLRTTIGEENYFFYINNGYFDIVGTNNSIYRIMNSGKISKMRIEIKKDLLGRIKYSIIEYMTGRSQKRDIMIYEGRIRIADYPLEDSIAIVYANIMKDSDRFDKDKCCGMIYAESIVD